VPIEIVLFLFQLTETDYLLCTTISTDC